MDKREIEVAEEEWMSEYPKGGSRFPPEPPQNIPERQPETPTGLQVAVIIDDLGFNEPSARMVLTLPIPLTVSVLPFYPASRNVAELAHQAGKEVLLHLPMEPQGYPDYARPGDGVLLVNMSERDILVQLEKDLQEIPHIVGVSAHMGSRFTADLEGMRIVARELRRRGLFFIDNLTTNRSVGKVVAEEADLMYLERDIFLDDDLNRDSIRRQLGKVEEAALRFRKVVAVGHPHPETITELRDWIPHARARGIQFVRVTQLLGFDRDAMQKKSSNLSSFLPDF